MRVSKPYTQEPAEERFEERFTGEEKSVDGDEDFVMLEFPTLPVGGEPVKKKERKPKEDPRKTAALCALGYTGRSRFGWVASAIIHFVSLLFFI